MYAIVMFNRPDMQRAKADHKKHPLAATAYRWSSRLYDLSEIIDESVGQAKDFGDKHKPKIFFVKD